MRLTEGLKSTGRGLASATNRASRAGGLAAGVFLCITVLIINYEVIMRYFFTRPTIWVFEVSHYLLAVIFTWGFAYGLNEGAHIAVDVLKTRLSHRAAGWLEAVISLLNVAMIIFLIWVMSGMIMRTIARQETSPTLLAVPLHWPRLAIGVGLFLFGCQAIVLCWRNWQKVASAGGQES